MPRRSASSAPATMPSPFRLFAKIDVNGYGAHPLYRYLKSEKSGLLGPSIKWNFTKFLVDRSVGWWRGMRRPRRRIHERNRGPAVNENNDAKETKRASHCPIRLSTDPKSPYYNEAVLSRDVGIRFKGVEKTNVEEYCVSEGWVRVTAGNAKDRYGNPLTIKVHGPVEPYFSDKPS